MEDVDVINTLRPKVEQSLNIKDIFFKYIRFLPLYLICVALALFGSYAYLRYAAESYQSSANIVIQDDKTAPKGNTPIDIALQSDTRKNIPVEIEIMRSTSIMSRVVTSLNLNFDYVAKGKIKSLNLYKSSPFKVEALHINDSSASFTLNLNFVNQESFHINGGTELMHIGQTIIIPAGEFKIVRLNDSPISSECIVTWSPSVSQAGALLGGLAIVPRQGTGILSITMEASNPQLAADVINQLIKEYQTATVENKNKTSQQQLAFIDKELDSVSQQLDSINDKYVAYRNANTIIEPGTQSTNLLSQIEEANKNLQQQKIQLNQALQIKDYLSANDQSNTVPSSLGIQDPILTGLMIEYNKAQMERKHLLENAPEDNIVVKQKTGEIEILRSKILENINNIRSSFTAVVGTLQSTTSQAGSQALTMPSKERGLLDIQRNLQSKAIIYNSLLGKKEEASITLASTISDILILQGASPNTWPVRPNRRSSQMLALVIGVLIPTIIIVVLELLNDKINSKNDIERLTDATILGEVGHSFSEKTLVVTTGNRKVIAEQFRILRSNLQYVLTKSPKPVIMVTSSFSGEGKSFISTNMGAVMALANKKTIVLEFDIRKPKIVSGLNLPRQVGLTQFILGKAVPQDLPVAVPGCENLYVLACGPIPPNPAELLLDSKLDELFAWLHENFDVVIMDTAPVGMVSDAITLSKYADCTLYIMRQGHTFKKQIMLLDGYHREGKLPKVSVILNDVTIRNGYGSYAYGNYGGYGYGSGYFDDEQEDIPRINKWLGWLNGKKIKKKKRV